MASLITANNLSRYYGDHCAVDNISFSLEKGDILGFLGPNGAGKSTTMQMLTGNLAPHQGSIEINGFDLIDQPVEAKSQLGYLPENPPLYHDLNVEEYLHYCARLHRVPGKQIAKQAGMAMRRCDLQGVKHRLIRNLSKGFQQRVGIAQAILHQPPVIILDEPTVGLDPIQIIDIRALISELGADHGIILCTHILPEVQAICNRVQIINDGVIAYSADMKAQQETRYEIRLASAYEAGHLEQHEIFTRVETIDDNRFVIDSEADAADIVAFIIEQKLGLTHFTRYSDSLESTFVSIVSGSGVSDSADSCDDNTAQQVKHAGASTS